MRAEAFGILLSAISINTAAGENFILFHFIITQNIQEQKHKYSEQERAEINGAVILHLSYGPRPDTGFLLLIGFVF